MVEISTLPIPDTNLYNYPSLLPIVGPDFWPTEGTSGTEKTDLIMRQYDYNAISDSTAMAWNKIKSCEKINVTHLQRTTNFSLLALSTFLWSRWLRALSADEVSKPLLASDDLEKCQEYLDFESTYKRITVSPSLKRNSQFPQRLSFIPKNAGLLLWLESEGSSENDE